MCRTAARARTLSDAGGGERVTVRLEVVEIYNDIFRDLLRGQTSPGASSAPGPANFADYFGSSKRGSLPGNQLLLS